MPNQWTGVTIDCADPAALARFWSELLDRAVTDEHDGDLNWATVGSRRDDLPRLTFQHVEEPRQGKVRLHLDVQVEDIEAGRAQVEALGGRWIGERHDYDDGVVIVMHDPEGNEFCLVEYARTAPPEVRLEPMTDEEYDTWMAWLTESYAEDVARATQQTLEETRPRAAAQMAAALDSERAWFLSVRDAAGERVGSMWLAQRPDAADTAFVYDIVIDEAHRGRGLGRAAMLAAEPVVRAAGFTRLGLNVFGENDTAHALYVSLDYEPVATQMIKKLG